MRHQAEGILDILPKLEEGLTDMEGFSRLYVVWVFHRAEGCELLGIPPTDTRPHGVFAAVAALLTPSACRLWSYYVATARGSMSGAWTCSMERPSWTSNRTSRVFQRPD